jgi:hypothetical protein
MWRPIGQDRGVVELILGPMLRHVDRTSATVWVETDGPAEVEVLGHRTHTFTVAGHHFALVIVEGLLPGTRTEYDVRVDGRQVWPLAQSSFPPSSISTVGDRPVRVMFGSCRTAAPHEPPYTLEFALDPKGRGVDALRTHALRMIEGSIDQWPDIAVMLGDQIYADDSSPVTRERIKAKRGDHPIEGMSPDLVHGFDEYCWLYHESWSPEVERWFFSVVPTTMIFDDHDMIDDWNISDTWVEDIRRQPWWKDHVVGGLTSYWIYQHLGNLSPDEIRAEGMLDALLELSTGDGSSGDGEAYLRAWAEQSEEFTPVPGGYRFSFARRLGNVALVVIDSRNGRVLERGHRSMVDDDEWAWIVRHCHTDARHLLIGTSLPVFVPGGIDDLQRWNERVCDGAWGRVGRRLGERVRRGLDLEDWPAFTRSFDALVELLSDLGSDGRSGDSSGRTPPATISILSGDIHFSYHSRIHFPAGSPITSHVHQLVNSPIRNALRPFERAAMRTATSRPGALIARVIRRLAGGRRTTLCWQADHGPVFDNCVGEVTFDGDTAVMRLERATAGDDGVPHLEVAFEVDLVRD